MLLPWDKILPITRSWTRVILHHSATKDGEAKDWDAIKNYHIKTKGWSDVGYNVGLEKIGKDIMVLEGRPFDQIGAHTIGMNTVAIGICVVGDYDKDNLPDDMYDCLCNLLVEICKNFTAIDPQDVHFHRDYTKEKMCPGIKFPSLEKIRAEVERRLA